MIMKKKKKNCRRKRKNREKNGDNLTLGITSSGNFLLSWGLLTFKFCLLGISLINVNNTQLILLNLSTKLLLQTHSMLAVRRSASFTSMNVLYILQGLIRIYLSVITYFFYIHCYKININYSDSEIHVRNSCKNTDKSFL